MAWRKPTEDDIVATISMDELEAYKASANWEADPVDILLSRAAAMVRDAIRTNGEVTMSPEELEIPEGCISPAMDYLAYDIVKRIGGAATEERKQAREEAKEYFEKIAEGKIRPESYGMSEGQRTGGSAMEIVTAARKRMRPEQLEGL